MSPSPLNLKQLFVGVLTGQGQITGLTGRVLAAFSLEFYGEWSIGCDALHLDEVMVYADGHEVRRHWAAQFDADGGLLAFDSQQAARLRGRSLDDRARLVFDRSLAVGPEVISPRVVIEVFEDADGRVRLEGRTKLLGLTLRRSRAVLNRG